MMQNILEIVIGILSVVGVVLGAGSAVLAWNSRRTESRVVSERQLGHIRNDIKALSDFVSNFDDLLKETRAIAVAMSEVLTRVNGKLDEREARHLAGHDALQEMKHLLATQVNEIVTIKTQINVFMSFMKREP